MISLADGITLDMDLPESVTSGTGNTDDVKRVSTSAKRDAPPKGKKQTRKQAAKKAVAQGTTTQEIEAALSMILSLPAMPCEMAGDDWAANHFMVQGPNLAKEVARQSERSPVLRSWCEKLVGGEALAALVLAGFMYAMPPMMHWGLLPAPDQIKASFGVPTVTPEQATEKGSPNSNGSNGSNAKSDITGAL